METGEWLMHPEGIEGTFNELFRLITWINRLVGFVVGVGVGVLIGWLAL